MNNKFIQFQINAPGKLEADKIIDCLLKEKLVAGTTIMPSKSKFWWKGKIDEENYYIIYGFSVAKNKAKIIRETKKYHSDEVPGIIFWGIDANEDFLRWIEENVK